MASLNTLRTKYGIVLSVVIALVLVAFILGDQLSMRGKYQDVQDNTVLTIDGKNIKQSDYYTYSQKYAMEGANPDQNAQLIYQQILFNEYLHPAYQAAGLGFNTVDEEIMYRQYAENFIANTPEALTMTTTELQQAIDSNWNYMKYMYGGDLAPMVATDKASMAYSTGKFANKLEVNEELRNSNLTFDGHYVMLPYSVISCEEATAAEIEAYYNAHRVENPNYGARTLSIVRFNIIASEEDKAAVAAAVMEADAAARKANGDAKAIKSALRNVEGKVENYVALSTLTDEEAKAIKAGENYGPVLNGDTWVAKYLVSKVSAPESFTFSAISAESNSEAEKLVEDIKAVNGNLESLVGVVRLEKSKLSFVLLVFFIKRSLRDVQIHKTERGCFVNRLAFVFFGGFKKRNTDSESFIAVSIHKLLVTVAIGIDRSEICPNRLKLCRFFSIGFNAFKRREHFICFGNRTGVRNRFAVRCKSSDNESRYQSCKNYQSDDDFLEIFHSVLLCELLKIF
jgi:hypothetical protein